MPELQLRKAHFKKIHTIAFVVSKS